MTPGFWRSPGHHDRGGPRAVPRGGMELAIGCDITIAAENAMFGEPELKFGAFIVTMILPWIVGQSARKKSSSWGSTGSPQRRRCRRGS